MILSVEYMAGFFDGEGCLSMTKVRGCWFSPEATVANTDYYIMKAFAYTLELCNVKHKFIIRKLQLNRKPLYCIRVREMRSLYVFCQLLRPSLKIKQSRADLMLKFLKLRLAGTHRDGYHSPEEEIIAKEIKEMNQRGTRYR